MKLVNMENYTFEDLYQFMQKNLINLVTYVLTEIDVDKKKM
jgi:hypothetical protein